MAATAEYQACAVCSRTILRGERVADYIDGDGQSAAVCPLCKARAEASGWLPAAVAARTPAAPPRRRGAAALRERLAALRTPQPEATAPELPDEAPPPMQPLDVFNSSGEVRKVAGLRKSLGEPRVTVRDEPGEVVITVAWDLSWYRWRVRGSTVKQVAKGNEISELPLEDRAWNAVAGEDGKVSLA